MAAADEDEAGSLRDVLRLLRRGAPGAYARLRLRRAPLRAPVRQVPLPLAGRRGRRPMGPRPPRPPVPVLHRHRAHHVGLHPTPHERRRGLRRRVRSTAAAGGAGNDDRGGAAPASSAGDGHVLGSVWPREVCVS